MPPPLRTADQQLRIRKNEEPFFFPISYSRIKGFQECQLRYKFENIDKLGRISGEAAELGTAAHTFQEVMHTDGIDRANDIARALVPLSQSDEWLNAKKIIESIVIKKDHLYLSEKPLHMEFPGRKDGNDYTIQLEAKIDQLFVYPDQAEIIDGKSGRQVDTDLDNDPQGKIYGVVVLENLGDLGFKDIIFTQAQWRYGRLVSTTFSIEELQEYKYQIMAVGQKMLEETEFEPTPGNHCHWCPFVMRCDAAQKMLPPLVEIAGEKLPPAITSDEEAEIIGQGVLHLEEIAKRYRAAIRGYAMETQRPVKVGKGGWGWWKRSTLKLVDLDVLIQLAQEKKIRLVDFLSFNNKIGKTLVKNHPEFLEGLNEEQYAFFDFKANIQGEDD
jgi:RecB family exonuclease